MKIPARFRRWPAVVHVAAALALSVGAGAAAPVAGGSVQAPDRLWQIPVERPSGPEIRGEAAIFRFNAAPMPQVTVITTADIAELRAAVRSLW